MHAGSTKGDTTMAEGRRGFLRGLMTTLGAGAAAATGRASAASPSAVASGVGLGTILPAYARAQSYRSLKESTYDRTGGNADARPIAPGATLTVFEPDRRRHHHARLVHHRRARATCT